jgi:hypothetical protein
VKVTGLYDHAGITLALPRFTWTPIPALGVLAGQLNAMPPGTYKLVVDTVHGSVEGMVTVEVKGECLQLTP